MRMALAPSPLFSRHHTRNCGVNAPYLRVFATFPVEPTCQRYDFLRISASVQSGCISVTETSFYASKIQDKPKTRNLTCPSKSRLPSFSLLWLLQLAHNKKSQLQHQSCQSRLLPNWANNTLARRVLRALQTPHLGTGVAL